MKPQETGTGTVRQPVGEDACPTGKGFRFRSVMGWRGDALRLVRADTAALRSRALSERGSVTRSGWPAGGRRN